MSRRCDDGSTTNRRTLFQTSTTPGSVAVSTSLLLILESRLFCNRPIVNKNASDQSVLDAAKTLLPLGREGQACLELATPGLVATHLDATDALLAKVQGIVRAAGVRLEYYEISEPRYRHYLAAALSLPRGAR